jgi:hypothetical protein
MPPELLEPPRAQPDFEAMDDVAEYAQTLSPSNREPLEGGLWLPL